MTTPAVNIHTYRNYSDTIIGHNQLGNRVTYYGCEVSQSSWWKSRPASVSTKPVRPGPRPLPRSPFDKSRKTLSGIRPVTEWSHLWSITESSMAAITVMLKYKPVNPNDISIWDYPPGSLFYRPCYNSTVLSVPASVVSRADRAMLENLQNQSIDVGVFFAELHEAVETVTSTATRIASEVTSFKRHNRRDWLRVLRHEDKVRRQGRLRTRVNELPSQYLAMQYGWNPLLQDVQHSLSLVNDQLFGGDGAVVRVKGKAASKGTDRVGFSSNGPFSSGIQLDVFRNWRLSCRTYAYYRLRNANLAKLSQLGLINPAVIIWEKIPYSFVVDWFAPVGPWLNSLTAASGYDFVTGCRSTMSVVTDVRPVVALSDYFTRNYNILGDPSNVYAKYKCGRFIRTVLTSSPVPGFYFKNPISTVHMANALALLRNAFRR